MKKRIISSLVVFLVLLVISLSALAASFSVYNIYGDNFNGTISGGQGYVGTITATTNIDFSGVISVSLTVNHRDANDPTDMQQSGNGSGITTPFGGGGVGTSITVPSGRYIQTANSKHTAPGFSDRNLTW